jgi:hypothetical protein
LEELKTASDPNDLKKKYQAAREALGQAENEETDSLNRDMMENGQGLYVGLFDILQVASLYEKGRADLSEAYDTKRQQPSNA